MPLLSRARRALAAAALLPALVACSSPAAPPAPLPPLTPIMVPPTIASSAAPALVGPRWGWRETMLAGGKQVSAADASRYTLEFTDDGRVLVRADCNRGSARYTTTPEGGLSLTPAALTRMACPPDTQDGEFLRHLALVSAYRFGEGELVLALRAEGDAMRFRTVDR